MRGAMGALALMLAVPVVAQDQSSYTAAENPYQAEYTFVAGQPIVLKVQIQTVAFDTLTVTPEPASGKTTTCTVNLDGANQGDGKVTVTGVLLLEDANGHALERLTMAPFKVKSGRPFARSESLDLQAATLTAAVRIYLFLKVD